MLPAAGRRHELRGGVVRLGVQHGDLGKPAALRYVREAPVRAPVGVDVLRALRGNAALRLRRYVYDVDLRMARLVGDIRDFRSVGAPRRLALARGLGVCEPSVAPAREDVKLGVALEGRGDRDLGAVGRNCCRRRNALQVERDLALPGLDVVLENLLAAVQVADVVDDVGVLPARADSRLAVARQLADVLAVGIAHAEFRRQRALAGDEYDAITRKALLPVL